MKRKASTQQEGKICKSFTYVYTFRSPLYLSQRKNDMRRGPQEVNINKPDIHITVSEELRPWPFA
jgi:hypothetical protein